MTLNDPGSVPREPAEIGRLYHELALLGARTEGPRAPWRFGKPGPEELLVLAAQASRYEPRLLWAIVDLLVRSYDGFNPLKLRRALGRARWPAALGVAYEFARLAARSRELDEVADFVMAHVPPVQGERFFLGTRAFAGELARRDVEESLAQYRRWGYFSREEPIAKELGVAAHGTLGPHERLNLLRRLVERRGSVTMRDYLAALQGRASRRQASRDLRAARFLVCRGKTRGACYRLAMKPRPRKVDRS